MTTSEHGGSSSMGDRGPQQHVGTSAGDADTAQLDLRLLRPPGSPDGIRDDEDSDDAGDGGGADAGPPRHRRGLRRTLIALGVLALVLALVVGGGFWYLTNRYAGNIDR